MSSGTTRQRRKTSSVQIVREDLAALNRQHHHQSQNMARNGATVNWGLVGAGSQQQFEPIQSLSSSQLIEFIKRKLPAITSLIVGVFVGLVVAGTFSKDVRLPRPRLDSQVLIVEHDLSHLYRPGFLRHSTRAAFSIARPNRASIGRAQARKASKQHMQEAIEQEAGIRPMSLPLSRGFACSKSWLL
jgi:hypothetical protein